MSGFKIGRVFELDFSGTDADGAVVKVRSTSVGVLNGFLSGEQGIEQDAAVLAKHLVSWNLERENGEPLPLTAEGLMELEEPLLRLITVEWVKATRGITAPLDHRSSGGEKSPEESIPMETT